MDGQVATCLLGCDKSAARKDTTRSQPKIACRDKELNRSGVLSRNLNKGKRQKNDVAT